MGEDSTDDLLERENSLAETMAEQEAVEAGGLGASGMSYYDDGGYNYDESSELTDIDYNPYDDSKAFTESGDGTDAYAKQFGQDDDDEQADVVQDDEPMGSMMRWGQPAAETYTDDYDEEESDDYDSDEEDEDDENDDDDEDDDEESSDAIGEQQDGTQDGARKAKSKKADYDGAIKWKPGDAITIALLGQVWSKCRKIEKVRPYIDQANEAIKGVLNEMGPNLMLRLNNWIDKLSDSAADTIGSLVDLASKTGRRMTLLSIAAVKGIFDQQHMETFLLATLPTILQTAISTNPVKAILDLILKISVPIINRAARKK